MDEHAWALEILGLTPGSTTEDIRRARRELAQIYHPDRFATNDRLRQLAEDRMKVVNAACEVLLSDGSEGMPSAGSDERPEPPPPTASDVGSQRSHEDALRTEQAILESALSEARGAMGVGIAFVVGGGLLTALTMSVGFGVVFWGAIVWGLWRVFKVASIMTKIRKELSAIDAVLGGRSGFGSQDASPLQGQHVAIGVVVVVVLLSALRAGAPYAQGPTSSAPVFSPGLTPSTTSPQSAPGSSQASPAELSFGDPAAVEPAPGSAERQGMMDAARSYLNTGTQFYVHRIAVKGDLGAADIEPYPTGTGTRVQLAFKRSGGGWIVTGRMSGTAPQTQGSPPPGEVTTFPMYFGEPGSTEPQPGSGDRKALMDAARVYLGTSTEFYIHQIAVKGDLAMADMEPYPTGMGSRVVLGFERRSGQWIAVGVLR